jgi:hypothetical protein
MIRILKTTIFCVIANLCFGQLWQFNFDGGRNGGGLNVSIDNVVGTPTIQEKDIDGNSYFAGLNADCTGTTTGSDSARSAQSWAAGDYWQFSFNATNLQSMNFSVCMRTSNAPNTGQFKVIASKDNGASWDTIVPSFNFSGTGSNITSKSGSLPSSYDNQSDVKIQILKTDNAPASTTAIRIDDATLTGTNLPVDLIYFKTLHLENAIKLDWQTASEVDNDYFEVQRSLDGQHFESIAKIQGKGTVDFTHDYSFIDEKPNVGLNYYRLKQVDIGGKFDLSAVSVVDFIPSGKVNINYIANSETIRVATGLEKYSFQVFDMMGRQMKSVGDLRLSSEVSVDELPQGSYQVILIGKSDIKHTFRFFKQ